VEYAHLRRTTKPNLKAIYAVGEKIAGDVKRPFIRRPYYPVG
jgi:uroporphyrinogen-III synthase